MPGTITEVPKKTSKKSPQKPEIPPLEYVKPSKEPFPAWPKGEGKGGYCKAEDLFGYWDGLIAEFIARTNFYVNREHPKLDRMQELTEEQRAQVKSRDRRPPAKYIDKVATPWREKDLRSAILRRYGSGDYKIFLNDAGVGGNVKDKDPDLTSRNLCKCLYSVWDSDFPPILDPSRPDKGIGILDWTHPANASYVAELRMKGIRPPNTKEEDDVPNDVVKTLVDKVGTLADKVATHEQDRLVDRIAEKVNPNGNNGQSAASQIVDVMRAARELNPLPAPVAPIAPVNAEAQMAGTLALVERIMSMKAENPMVELYKMQLQATVDEMKEYRAETRRLQEQLSAKKDEGGDGGIESMIDKFAGILPKLQGVLGLGGDKLTDVVHGRKESVWERLALSVIPQLTPGVNTLMSAAANYFLAPKNGLGGPPPTQPAQLPAGQQQAPADPQMEQLRHKVGGFLGANIFPMQKHFKAFLDNTPRDVDDLDQGNQDGSDFAFWIYDNFGMEILQSARQLGSANITAMFKAAPAIWAAIQPNEVKFNEFLDQVLAFQPDPDEPAQKKEEKVVDLT